MHPNADNLVPAEAPPCDLTVAILLSCDTFESFFTRVMGHTPDSYVERYRNDFAWYYAAGLRKQGVRVVLYVSSTGAAGLRHTPEGIDVRFLPVAWWYRPLAPLRRAFRATRWSLYFQERVNAASFLRPLRDALKRDGVDVLYVQEYWGGRLDHYVGRVDAPTVGHDHGGLADRTVTWFKRRTFARVAGLYGQTENECGVVNRFGGDALLQPNGIDADFFRPDPAARRDVKTILTVARLTDKQKRTSDAIRALRHLDGDWSLDVAGTGPDRAMLEKLASDLGVADRVRFLGFVSKDEVRRRLQTCGVYTMPSSNEGLAMAILEAMGCGASVVVTDIRAFRTVVANDVNGLTVPVGDPARLARAIEQAWADRIRLGRAAAESVRTRFDAATLYEQLAARLRRAAKIPSAA